MQDFHNLYCNIIEKRYEIYKCLHQTLAGAIYAARDNRFVPPRDVALKMFSSKLTAYRGYEDKFRQEAEIAGRLQGPYICKVLDFGKTYILYDNERAQVNYLCMEFMHGGSLADRLEDDQKIPVDKIIDWARKLGEALDSICQQGVIHSGIKLSSIVFDQQNNPYLADFAIATTVEDKSNHSVIGAPAFLAPEQWEGLKPTPAIDQYSFAILLYILVTGKRPYERQENHDERERNFAHGPPQLTRKRYVTDEVTFP